MLKALILGSQPLAEHLVECFQLNQMKARILGKELPLLSDRKAMDKLRAVLSAELEAEPFDLLHPGAQAWADRQELQLLAEEFGFTLIAPPARLLSLFSNKLALLSEAEKQGVPTSVLSLDPLHSEREIERALEGALHPVVLKSARGIGGSGICVIQSPEEMKTKLPLWLEQLRLHLGEVTVFPEKYISEGRMISLPFARIQRNSPVFFSCVDVSLQSRGRKLVQVCPAPSLDADAELQIQKYAAQLIQSTGFNGVGSFEFLVEGKRVYLLEGMARLNTSFRLWENIANTRALDWQLAALGMSETPELRGAQSGQNGISLRLYAEDPHLQIPQPGRVFEISEARSWTSPQAKAELHLCIEEGQDLAQSSSGILGELYAFGPQAHAVFTLAQGALDESWISGSLQTNQRFLSELIQHPWIKEGIFHAGFIDEEFLCAIRPDPETLQLIASLAPLLDSPAEEFKIVVAGKLIRSPGELLVWDQGPEKFDVNSSVGIRGVIRRKEGFHERLCAYPLVEDRWKVRLGLWEVVLKRVSLSQPPMHKIASLAAGEIHSVLFREGSVIPAHVPLVLIRSLGVLIPHALPRSVRILKWKVSAEDPVELGQELAEFELIDEVVLG